MEHLTIPPAVARNELALKIFRLTQQFLVMLNRAKN